MFLFYTTLKTLENQRFSGVLGEYKMGTLDINGLNRNCFPKNVLVLFQLQSIPTTSMCVHI